jgi:LCP family protein required for cell wall assembly
MSDTPTLGGSPDHSGDSVGPGGTDGRTPGRVSRRKHRGLRITLVSLASFVVLVGAIAAGGYAFLNHLTGSIQRIPVKFTRLDASGQHAGEYNSYGGAMTVLITGEDLGPTGGRPITGPSPSGLIMLLHVNASGYNGGVVEIPPQSIVNVPGHGRMEIEDALDLGGPSLLVQTIQDLTHVQIDHYARIDLTHVDRVVNAMGGVDVRLPDRTDGFGHVFHIGIDDLNGRTALDYAREQNLTEEERVLRQESLMRAVVRKLVHHHLLSNPLTDYRVLHAMISMLTVDSNFTTGEIEHLAMKIRGLTGSADYVTAPVRYVDGQVHLDRRITRQLWAAIRQDEIAAFARKYPFTVTPAAPH